MQVAVCTLKRRADQSRAHVSSSCGWNGWNCMASTAMVCAFSARSGCPYPHTHTHNQQ